jgi:hypothetical protein
VPGKWQARVGTDRQGYPARRTRAFPVVVVYKCVRTNSCVDNSHGDVHSGTCISHWMLYTVGRFLAPSSFGMYVCFPYGFSLQLCEHQCVRGQFTWCRHSGTCVCHMTQYVPLACPVAAALAHHLGDTHTCWRKVYRESGVHCMQQVDTSSDMQWIDPFSVHKLIPGGGMPCDTVQKQCVINLTEVGQIFVLLHHYGEKSLDNCCASCGCKECWG